MSNIKAITFDLWDTLVVDDSDENKRAELGLRTKFDERRHLLWDALNNEDQISLETVQLAYNVGDAAFNKVWKEHHITWTIDHRLKVILNGLGRELEEASFNKVVRAHEEMEVDIPPDAMPGASSVLERLANQYKLCIVSDAIVSPGKCLRKILENHGLAKPFSGYAFSDEVGRSKPHRVMFGSAAEQLGVKIEEMVHVGDRDHNDVKGPQRLGMKAILFTASRDIDKDNTTADSICEAFDQIESSIKNL